VVADPDEFNKAIPDGVGVEYLSQNHRGVGARFRATRLVRGKPQTFDQEVTEYTPGHSISMINVTHGTRWEGRFTVQPADQGTIVTLTMDAVTDHLFARVMNRLIGRMLQRALDKDMDAVKTYCER
jgi:hypothetical protein